MNSIHENIRSLRRERQLTQEQLAETMGVSSASVSKWENGGCAPDLSAIIALADYFEVSIDMLMGHRLHENRLEERLKSLNALVESPNALDAEATQILRFYPNSFEAAEGCANAYHELYLHTGEKKWIGKSVDLTERLFALGRGESEAQKLARTNGLGGLYEIMEDWDNAEKCYRAGNVGGLNDRHLASCAARRGETEKAVTMISDVLQKEMYTLVADVMQLEQLWSRLGRFDLACAALEWIAGGMERFGLNAALLQTVYYGLASESANMGDRQRAESAIRRAARLVSEPGQRADFLRPGEPRQPGQPDSRRKLLDLLTGNMDESLKAAMREELSAAPPAGEPADAAPEGRRHGHLSVRRDEDGAYASFRL